MATHSTQAQLEKRMLKFIDGYLDSNCGCTLSNLEHYFDQKAPTELIKYVEKSDTNLRNFLNVRKQLWITVGAPGSDKQTIQKHSDDTRSMLYDLSKYIQTNRPNQLGGVQLQKIYSLLQEHYRHVISNRITQGLDGVKNYLFSFPLLFEMSSRDGQRVGLGESIFLSLVTLQDGTIILPERLHGIGAIAHFNEDRSNGFINLDGQGAYFVRLCIQPPSIRSNISDLIEKKTKFRFTAVISTKYLKAEASNKWRIIEMWPYHGQDGDQIDSESDQRPMRSPMRSRSRSRRGTTGERGRSRSASVRWNLDNPDIDTQSMTGGDTSYPFDDDPIDQSPSQPDHLPSLSATPSPPFLKNQPAIEDILKNLPPIETKSLAPSTKPKPKSNLACKFMSPTEPQNSHQNRIEKVDKNCQTDLEIDDNFEVILCLLKSNPHKVENILCYLKAGTKQNC